MSAKKVSLRARNLNPEPIKVNDKASNPVLIGMVLVWRLKDTYKALFDGNKRVSQNAEVLSNSHVILNSSEGSQRPNMRFFYEASLGR